MTVLEMRNEVVTFLIAKGHFNKTVSENTVKDLNHLLQEKFEGKYSVCPRNGAYIEDHVKKTFINGYDIYCQEKIILSVTI